MTAFADDDIRSITENVWTTMLGLEVQDAATWAASDDAPDVLTGFVQITGAWGGAVVLHCPTPLARRVAAVIFDVEPESVSGMQVVDALGELVNMTGGNIKGLLPQPSKLSLPTVVTSATRHHVPDGRTISRVTFACDGEPFQVTVLQREAGTAAAVPA